jgi:hypothetical protein
LKFCPPIPQATKAAHQFPPPLLALSAKTNEAARNFGRDTVATGRGKGGDRVGGSWQMKSKIVSLAIFAMTIPQVSAQVP